jgi:ATP-dependent DNA helicase RecQ
VRDRHAATIDAEGRALNADALRVLREVFGYPDFRGAQAEIVEHVIDGGDALVLIPTGGGKSLCYQIPAIVRDGVGLVVSPLIALMQDQVAALHEAGVRAAFLNSTLSGAEAAAIENDVRAGRLDLLYVAPERLVSERTLGLLARTRLALVAIDEAHCVSQWGHDFRPEYMQLAILAERFPDVPRIALTATADALTRREILEKLHLDRARVFVSSFDRPNIRYRIVEKDSPGQQLLQFIRNEHAGDAGIVYCLSRAKVEETAAFLSSHGVPALAYHAGMDAATRAANQNRFLREDGLVMCATIAFGMGIDKPDVRFVAHLDLPKTVESYYQETGRAGRDGLASDAWMAYGLQDVVQQRRMIEEGEADETHKRVLRSKLDAMLALCETVECRRVRLLGYFGEAATPCGNCDNCLAPPRVRDGTEAAQKFLSAMIRCERASGFAFGSQQIIDVLRGRATDKVVQRGHDQLPTFGVGADVSEREWRSILRQLVMQGLVRVDHDGFNVLRLTEASRAVLKGERRVELREEPEVSSRRRSERRKGGGAAAAALGEGVDAGLFEALRAWRARTAKEHGVPAYVIFHDATLAEIARARPADRTALGRVSGVGAAKLERYGEEILGIVGDAG